MASVLGSVAGGGGGAVERELKRMLFLQCKLMTRAGQQLTPHKPPTLTSVPPVQRGTHLFVGPLPASLVPGADAALSPLGVALSLPAQGDIRSDGQRAHRPEGRPEKPSDPPWGRGRFPGGGSLCAGPQGGDRGNGERGRGVFWVEGPREQVGEA